MLYIMFKLFTRKMYYDVLLFFNFLNKGEQQPGYTVVMQSRVKENTRERKLHFDSGVQRRSSEQVLSVLSLTRWPE